MVRFLFRTDYESIVDALLGSAAVICFINGKCTVLAAIICEQGVALFSSDLLQRSPNTTALNESRHSKPIAVQVFSLLV